jgi:hypothetical protein
VTAAQIGGDDEAERQRRGWGRMQRRGWGEDAATLVGAAARVRYES